MALRDLALTVLELEAREYHWVLMEAVQADSEDCLVYRPVDSSTKGLPDYSEALIQGASALRVLQGLAPFGKPVEPAGIGDDAAPAARPTSGRGSRVPKESDSCMLTTDNSLL